MFSSSIRPSAISRSAITVGLSVSSSTSGSAPLAIWRARWAAMTMRLNRFGSTSIQSSTVTRAISTPEIQSRDASKPLSIAHHRCEAKASRASRGRQQFLEQPAVAVRLSLPSNRPGADDRRELLARRIEVVVDDDPVERQTLRDLGPGLRQSPPDDLRAIGAARSQPHLERLQRRRQDEDSARARGTSPNLRGTLDVDFQQYVLAFAPARLDLGPVRAVAMTEHLGMLQVAPARHALAERVRRNEVVVLTVDFAAADGPGR